MTNIIWLFIDSLRKDVFESTDTSIKKEIFEKGINLTNCFSQGAWTYPSFISFITGKYPTSNGSTILNLKNKDKKEQWSGFLKESISKIDQKEKTIFDILKEKNFKNLTVCDKILGQKYNYRNWNILPETTPMNQITNWIEKNQNEKFFLFIRTNLIHYPWECKNKNYIKRAINKSARILDKTNIIDYAKYKENADIKEHKKLLNLIERKCKNNKEKEIKQKMSVCLKKVDNKIFKPLLNKIKELNLEKDTIFIINSDHGDTIEEFVPRVNSLYKKENQFLTKLNKYNLLHVSCFDEVIKVPCAIKYEKLEKKEIDSMTRLIDILPTTLKFIDINKEKFDGKNILDKEKLENIDVSYCESQNSICLRTKSKKIIYYPDSKKYFVFDLKEDSQEKNPIEDKEIKDGLIALLNKNILKEKYTIEKLEQVNEDIIKQRLKNLGYI